MEEQFYSLVLDEYAAPSFCTFTKGYYGSLEDIKGLVNALDTDEHHREYHLELINAFHAYERGDHTMSYKAAYAELPLLEPVVLLGTETLRMENYAWSHTNVWDCQYHLRCESVESTHWWIKHKNRYLRVAKARFVNLQYHNSIRGWIPMPHRFWGWLNN